MYSKDDIIETICEEIRAGNFTDHHNDVDFTLANYPFIRISIDQVYQRANRYLVDDGSNLTVYVKTSEDKFWCIYRDAISPYHKNLIVIAYNYYLQKIRSSYESDLFDKLNVIFNQKRLSELKENSASKRKKHMIGSKK